MGEKFKGLTHFIFTIEGVTEEATAFPRLDWPFCSPFQCCPLQIQSRT
jgi:hypothetical protein